MGAACFRRARSASAASASALHRALLARQPATGLLVHSDRSEQYCSDAYRALLADHHCLRSQSRRAECLDITQAESLWSRLKTE